MLSITPEKTWFLSRFLVFLFTIMDKLSRADWMSLFSIEDNTAKACFSIPLIAMVVFSRIPLTIIEIIIVSKSVTTKVNPISNEIINVVTIPVALRIRITPPNFSIVCDEFLQSGVSFAIKDPIHAVG
jgi:hypothetical protein